MVAETALYDILHIAPDATIEEVSRSYKKIALRCHPDKTNHDPQLTEQFKQITRAYEVLKDDKLRTLYDRFGEAGLAGSADTAKSSGNAPPFRSATDVFSQVFNDINSMFMRDMNPTGFANFGSFPFNPTQPPQSFNMNFRSRMPDPSESKRHESPAPGKPKRPVRGKDIFHTCKASLEDLMYGKRIKLRLPRKSKCEVCLGYGGFDPKTCTVCQGSGRVLVSIYNQFSKFQEVGPCRECHGEGITLSDRCSQCEDGYLVVDKILELLIEPGTRDGDKIILKSAADEGKNIIPGDVVITIKETPHPFLVRRFDDLYMEHNIDLKTALLGGWISIKDYIRKNNDLKIFINVHGNAQFNDRAHAAIQQGEIVGTINSGTPKIVKGVGMPINNTSLNGGAFYQDGIVASPDGSIDHLQRGDLFIKFNVKLPSVEDFHNGVSDLSILRDILPDARDSPADPARSVEAHHLSNIPDYSPQSPERQSLYSSSPDTTDNDRSAHKKRRQFQ